MKKAIACVYWIHLPEHTDPKTEGYLGVSTNFTNRIKGHYTDIQKRKHKNPHLVHAVEKYGWDNLLKEVIFTDVEDNCYLKEAQLRPSTNIGWNISSGGHKGPGRKKGQSLSSEHIQKMKETVRLRNERIASGNLTEEDQIFLDKKIERRLIALHNNEEKKKKKLEDKELKKQKKLVEREVLLQQKRNNRTRGMVHTQQPHRPFCEECKTSLAKPNGISKHGFKKWHKYCSTCAKAAYNEKFGFLLNKETHCGQCGFVAEDTCQLDIVYKDGNSKNKIKDNMKTLCANCNRLHQKKLREKKKSLLDITVDADVHI